MRCFSDAVCEPFRGVLTRFRCVCHHPGDACTLGRFCAAHLVRACSRVMVLFHLLHRLCMRWQFPREYGEPPLTRGMSSSTTGDIGCGTHPSHGVPVLGWVPGHFGPCSPGVILRDLFTGRSQRAQLCSSRSTRLRSSRRRCPLAEGWSVIANLPRFGCVEFLLVVAAHVLSAAVGGCVVTVAVAVFWPE